MHFFEKYRRPIIASWVILSLVALYLYYFAPEIFSIYLKSAFSYSVYVGYTLFILLGCFRSFVFIPSTALIVLGFLFFSPQVLFTLTMIGILVSSSLAYWFAYSLEFGKALDALDHAHVSRIQTWLAQYELPVVIVWSMFPFSPTDVICYVCGALRINYFKFILGIFIGETVCVGTYVYFGDALVHIFI